MKNRLFLFLSAVVCVLVLSTAQAFAAPAGTLPGDQKLDSGLKQCITQPQTCTNSGELKESFKNAMVLGKEALDNWLDWLYSLLQSSPLPVPAPTPPGMPQPQDIPEVQVVPVPQPGSPTPKPYTP